MPSTKNPNTVVQPGSGKVPVGSGSSGAPPLPPIYNGGPDWADGTTNPPSTVNAQINKIISDLASESVGLDGARKIGSDALASWLDATANPADSIYNQLTKIITDLSSNTGGSAKIGSAAIVGANDTIAAAGLHTQLAALKLASHIEYAGGGTWADASTNPATLVSTQLSKIVSDLSGSGGTAKVGSSALVGANDTIAAGTLFSQLGLLKLASHIEYAGGGSWAGGTSPTNPATLVGSQLSKIITDLSATTSGASGSDRIGAGALVGVSSTITAGTLFAALTALKSAANIDKAAGPNWADNTTTPAATLSTFINNIVGVLAASSPTSGAKRVGFNPAAGNFTAGTIQDALDQLTSTTVSDGATIIGSHVTGSFVTNNVRGQLDELDTTRAKLSGASFTGQVGFSGGFWPTLAGFGTITRTVPLRVAGMKTSTSATIIQSTLPTPLVQTAPLLTTLDSFLLDLSEVIPDGATLVAVVISTKGLAGSLSPANTPTYQIIRWNGADPTGLLLAGAKLSAVTADGHTYGGGGDWQTTQVDTTVTVNANATIDKNTYVYYLIVNSPNDPGSGAQMQIGRLQVQYTLANLRI